MVVVLIIIIGFFLGGQTDPMLLMTMVFFPFPKVPQIPSNPFISIVDNSEGLFFIIF